MPLSSEEIIAYLKDTSRENRTDKHLYYTLRPSLTWIEAPMMNGVFFHSPPFENIIFAIYQYMKEHQVPIWSGKNKGQTVDKITDIFEDTKSLHEFAMFADTWVSDNFISFDQIKIVKSD